MAAEQSVLETAAEAEEKPGQHEETRSTVSPPWYEDESPRPESRTRCHGGSVVSTDEETESEPPQTQDVGVSGSRRHEQSHDTEQWQHSVSRTSSEMAPSHHTGAIEQ